MNSQNLPQHIAIIMDGNGRWAKKRGLPRSAGHREGGESLRTILRACGEMGVKYLTVYAFSTENWQRPRKEVDFLMNFFSETIDKEMDNIDADKVKVNFLGRLSKFSPTLQEKMKKVMEKTKNNTKIVLNIMVNYGGRAEIIDAVNAIIKSGKKEAAEADIQNNLYTKGMPDPDLLIRTASEMRISNFLLWQLAYTEIYVTDVYWPDFKKEELQKAVEAYSHRERRYGGVKQ